MAYLIKKSSGQMEPFDVEKVTHSLMLAGASPDIIANVVTKVHKKKPKTTVKLHELIVQLLNKEKPPIAARYNIKRALMDLGPAGFPFEQFTARIFEAQGYMVTTNNHISGFCIEYEIDVIAHKDTTHLMLECKFHNRFTLKTDLKVTLYTHARFEDIKKGYNRDKNPDQKFNAQGIVTNTQFTTDAIEFAQCAGIQLLGWKYPFNNGIERLVDKLGLHPITALTTITEAQKRTLIQNGLVLCKEAEKHIDALHKLGFSQEKIHEFLEQTKETCTLQNK